MKSKKIKVTEEEMRIIEGQRVHWLSAYPGSEISMCFEILFANVRVEKAKVKKKRKAK